MKRIDAPGHVGNRFVAEDVATSRPPTEIDASWLNHVQEELCGLVEGAGIALSDASWGQLFQAVQKLTKAACPAGVTTYTASTYAPAGWLIADGRPVSRSTYADLFAAIGTTWGAGDGATTFNLPDLRRRFTRGADLGAGYDPMLTVGTYRDATLAEHSHMLPAGDGSGTATATYGVADGQPSAAVEDWTASATLTTRFKTAPVGGAETAPMHAVVLPIIRY